MCLLMQSGRCERETGMAANCCKTDHQTSRHQVLTTVATAPDKAVLASAPVTALPDSTAPLVRACAFETASRGPTKRPLDSTYLRNAALLI